MFRSLFIRLVLNAGSLYMLTYLMPKDITYTGGIAFFVVAGLFMTIINIFIKPILKILALPFIILTAGLFMIFINAFLLWILSYSLDIIKFQNVSLVIQSKGSYLVAGLLFGLLNWVLNSIFRK
jgi:putative membrane protein